jgi:hypothetical protein
MYVPVAHLLFSGRGILSHRATLGELFHILLL